VEDKAKTFLETRGYTFKRNLGEGTYGKVVSAYCKDRRRKVAIKVIDKEEVSSNYLEKFLPREMKIIRTLRHPNIVKTYDIFGLNSTKVYVVMELCGKGNLLRYINHHGALSEPLSCRLFTQLCKAIKYLHKKYVAHRDLKCENLLLDRHYNLKVCDFGFSKRLMYRHGNMVLSETYCGSWSYAAPEVLRGLPYNPKLSDVWSMGVVLYVFIYALMPLIPQRITIRNILCHPWMLRKWEMEDTDEAPLSNPGSRQEGQPDENTKEEEEPTQDSSDPGEGPSTCAPR
uniref:non-specific serine/threonine protein kinase n=1 Tax=Labrus bergylta TaxID=56723 RepID=A0A3Q3FGJ4_9LABR